MWNQYQKSMHAPLSALKNVQMNLGFEEYQKLPGLNYHGLKNFFENPLKWKEGWFDDRPETPAMKFGTMAHVLLLQGRDEFFSRYRLWTPPVNPKTGSAFGAETKAYKEAQLEWYAANPGKEPVSEETLKTLDAMRAETERNPQFQRFFRPGAPAGDSSRRCLGEPFAPDGRSERPDREPDEPETDGVHSEVMFRGPLDGVPELILKGAIDRYDDEFGIIDLKTTSALDKRFWKFGVEDRGYVDQLAFYQIAVHDVCGGGDKYPNAFIAAVETGGQFRSGIEWIAPPIMERARARVLDQMLVYATCVKQGIFNGPYDRLIIKKSYMGDAADD